MTSLRFGAPLIAGASAVLLAAAVASAANEATAAAAVVVYDQPDFKGRALTLSAATPDLGPLGFDNKIASLAIQGSGDWVLCENKNYGGRCVRVQRQAGDLGLLQLSGRVSSLYPVPATTTPAKP